MTERDTSFRVYTLMGVAPEIQAYALAKFSRSAKFLDETIRELSEDSAQKFLETFYFQYGHPSIADLAHFPLVLENIPLVQAIEVWDEPLIDGQESSTRYQNFNKRQFVTPVELLGTDYELPYKNMGNKLFGTYFSMKKSVAAYLYAKHQDEKPEGMSDQDATRIVSARTFDNIRYLLPASTMTNMGIIMSARTAEKMIVRLLSSNQKSIQELGVNIRAAIKDMPAFNLSAEKIEELFYDQEDYVSKLGFYESILGLALKDVKSAPTLVKYTNPSNYQRWMYSEALPEKAMEYLDDIEPESGRGVNLHFNIDPETEAAATALYRGSRSHSFKQALEVVEGMDCWEKRCLVDTLFKNRGPYDEPVRESDTGRMLIFDIETDNGAFRDLIRHRNNVKIMQNMTHMLGYDVPDMIKNAGFEDEYREVMEEAGSLAQSIEKDLPQIGQYILPLAYRRKMLMKMDTRQLQYIVEIRTKPEGHFSYRETTYQMYQQALKQIPLLARHIRVTHPSVENFWKR